MPLHFLRRLLDKKKTPLPGYNILIDSATGVLLTQSRYISDLVLLSETMPAEYVIHANYPHYSKDFFVLSLDPNEYPEWTWIAKEWRFVRTAPHSLTPEIRKLSRLATQKRDVLRFIREHVNRARYRFKEEYYLQETIYLTKRIQAQGFADSGYNEEKILEYPYVLQHAEHAALSLEQAARDILLRARLHEEVLVKTEALRLKYQEMIRETLEPEDLKILRKKFLDEFYYNTSVQ